jgi:hypothetical protein
MTIREMISHVREMTTIKLQIAAFTFFVGASQMERLDALPGKASRSTSHNFSTNLNEDLVTVHTKSCTADILSETANVSLQNTPYHPPSIVTGSTYILTVKVVVMAKFFQVIQTIKNVELKTLVRPCIITNLFIIKLLMMGTGTARNM